MIDPIRYHYRMAKGLMQMARQPHNPDPLGRLKEQIVNRDERFLGLLAEAVFPQPEHPYSIMFRLAGCSQQDFESLVRRQGLEVALEAVRAAGVYLTHDEMKGRTPIVRGGLEIPSTPDSFVNPAGFGNWEVVSSGTTNGVRARSGQSVATRTWREQYSQLVWTAFNAWEMPQLSVMPILPAPHCFTRALTAHRAGMKLDHWFAAGGSLKDSAHHRLATNILVLEAKLLGVKMPFPEYLPLHDFSPVARWIGKHGSTFVSCGISSAVYVADAARRLGVDLTGTVFHSGGEPVTAGKRAAIQREGAMVGASYRTNDVGPVGLACAEHQDSDAMHLLEDSLAAILHRRIAPITEVEVSTILFTTLMPTTPKLYINLDLDDAGEIVPAGCNCVFRSLGYNKLVRNVSSIGRMTGHGTTLVGTDILQILEVALPAAFGGAPGDYQLVEDDSGSGVTRIVLRVHPRLDGLDTQTVKEFFLGQIRRMFGGAVTVRGWQHGDSVMVVRVAPHVGASGKRLPLILSRHSV